MQRILVETGYPQPDTTGRHASKLVTPLAATLCDRLRDEKTASVLNLTNECFLEIFQKNSV